MLIPSKSLALKCRLPCFAVILTATALGHQASLKVSAIPHERPTELQRKCSLLGKYIESKIGMKFEFMPVTDYAATGEGLAASNLLRNRLMT